MVSPLVIASGIGAGSSLLGGKKAKKAGGQAAETIARAWEEAQQQYLELFNQAMVALSEGEAEASDEILQGLDMSIEERTKFFDIAFENLDWIVDFGKSFRGDAKTAMASSQKFLEHYSDLVFNPDAIYGTKVYQGIKNRTIEEWSNFYSGKGLLGGNAQEAMVERMAELGYNFLQGERDATARGIDASSRVFNDAMSGVGLGAQAAGKQSDFAMSTGMANAADIMGAYTNLAGLTQAFNPAQFLMSGAEFLGGGTANAGTAMANAQLGGNLGQSNIWGGLGNSLITAGLGGLFDRNSPEEDYDDQLTRAMLTKSTFTNRQGSPFMGNPYF